MAGPPFDNFVTWLLSAPAVIAGIGLWLFGWLLLEFIWYRRTKRRYDVDEAKRSLTAFAVVGIAQIAVSALLVPVLGWVWPYRLQTLAMDSVWHWAMAWLITDFVYYWIHRGLHVTGVGWSLHAPHHSIVQLSLLDSLRTSWGEQPVGVFAYGIPLVLLGVPPWIAGGFYLFVALYQFAVHTEINWTLGPLDAVIYTPAAHRSHHSTLRSEADRNYGGFFLVFDRIFGTWTPTTSSYRPDAYGLPSAHQASSLFDAVFGEMAEFARGLKQQRGLQAWVRFILTRKD